MSTASVSPPHHGPITALAFARIARDLCAPHRGGEQTLHAITVAAVGVIRGARSASITLTDKAASSTTQPHTPNSECYASTDVLSAALDDIERGAGSGPIAESISTRRSVLVCDLNTEWRWPAFTSATHRHRNQVRSILVVPLDTGGEVLGALAVVSTVADAFCTDSVETATAMGIHAVVALTVSRHEVQFERALASRDSIGQAKGMIMERYGIDSAGAFGMLSKISQDTNTPVVVLAERLIRRKKL